MIYGTQIKYTSRLIKVPISQGLFDCLVSFFFNNGAGNCPTLIKAVNSGNDDATRKALMLYTKAYDAKLKKKVTWPGLVTRRSIEIAHWAKMDEMDPKVPTPVVVGPALMKKLQGQSKNRYIMTTYAPKLYARAAVRT